MVVPHQPKMTSPVILNIKPIIYSYISFYKYNNMTVSSAHSLISMPHFYQNDLPQASQPMDDF